MPDLYCTDELTSTAWHAVRARPSIDPTGVNGLLDEFGGTGSAGSPGWNGLVACTYASDGLLVWLRSDGSTLTTVEAGSDSGTRSGTDMVNDAWDQARNAHVAAH